MSERDRGTRAAIGRRTKILGWTLIGLFPVVVLGGAELVARLLDLRPAGPTPAVPAWLDRNVLVKEEDWIHLLSDSPRDLGNYYRTYRWDRYLLYRLQPGLDITLTDVAAPAAIRDKTRWTFHTNARGYNAREYPRTKPPGVFRIVTLGDSSTFGWGVETESIYAHRLEARLSERHPGARIQVINLGVCGYSSFQGLVLLEREALALQPDVVTLSFGSNDYSEVYEPFDVLYERNRGWSGAVRAFLRHSRAYVYLASLLGSRSRDMKPEENEKGGAGGDRVLNVGADKSRENLIRMTRIAEKNGIDAIVVTNCVRGALGEPVREAAELTDTPLLDVESLLADAAPRVPRMPRYAGPWHRYQGLYRDALLQEFPWLAVYLVDRCHPNAIGHDLIAEALVPMVEETEAFRAYLEADPSRSTDAGAGPAP